MARPTGLEPVTLGSKARSHDGRFVSDRVFIGLFSLESHTPSAAPTVRDRADQVTTISISPPEFLALFDLLMNVSSPSLKLESKGKKFFALGPASNSFTP